MSAARKKNKPQEGENVPKNEIPDIKGNDDRFESDTQKIIHRHLEDEEDVITDEDIRNVRVGMTPPVLDEATEARFGDEETIESVEEKYIGKEGEVTEDDDVPASQKHITPWDTIDPKQ